MSELAAAIKKHAPKPADPQPPEPIEEKEFSLNAIKKYFPSAPVPDETVVPKGFRMTKTGIKLKPKDEEKEPVELCSEPIVITERFENITGGTYGMTVKWMQNGKWKTISRERDLFVIKNNITGLSKKGFPVTSLNANLMIQYLTAYEKANAALIPLATASEQLGWIEDGLLIGNDYVGQGNISFMAIDEGEKQIAEGYHQKGSLDDWLKTIKEIKDYPKVIAGVYASFASPLIRLLGSEPFIFEWSGETSRGKTIAEIIAASVWGNPTTDGILKKWNNTKVGVEKLATLANDIAIFLDDTKDAEAKFVSRSVYNLASGQGKGRGSEKGGMQKVRVWKNIIFSTGEQKITTFVKSDGGGSARVIPVTGLPFESQDKRKFVKSLERSVKKNYGSAGKVFAEYLIRNIDRVDKWQDLLEERTDFYAEMAGEGDIVSERLASHYALIDVGRILFNDCFGLDWGQESLVCLWAEILLENREVDRPKQALEDVLSWVYSEENRLFIRNGETIFKPADCIGKWNESKSEDLSLYTVKMDNFLKAQGYEPTAIVKSWAERGWIQADKNRMKKRVSVKGVKEWMYVIKINVIKNL